MIHPLGLKSFSMQWSNAPQFNAQKTIVFELLKATTTCTPSAALSLSHMSLDIIIVLLLKFSYLKCYSSKLFYRKVVNQ